MFSATLTQNLGATSHFTYCSCAFNTTHVDIEEKTHWFYSLVRKCLSLSGYAMLLIPNSSSERLGASWLANKGKHVIVGGHTFGVWVEASCFSLSLYKVRQI